MNRIEDFEGRKFFIGEKPFIVGESNFVPLNVELYSSGHSIGLLDDMIDKYYRKTNRTFVIVNEPRMDELTQSEELKLWNVSISYLDSFVHQTIKIQRSVRHWLRCRRQREAVRKVEIIIKMQQLYRDMAQRRHFLKQIKDIVNAQRQGENQKLKKNFFSHFSNSSIHVRETFARNGFEGIGRQGVLFY